MSEITMDGLSFTGERYLPDVPGQLELEHFHRYVLASKFAVGKRVLDIASGEGYGSALLASVADSVIGVDVSEEAVVHARARYVKNNLAFKVGDAAEIPLETASVDMVVSFETIEHHDRHDEMLAEVKRVLKPGGLFIISSPNKLNYTVIPKYSNPYHVKELFREEFQSLLQRSFENVRMFGQRVVYGSLIVSESDFGSGFTNYLKNEAVTQAPELQNPVYDLAFASDTALQPFGVSLYEQMHGEQDGATFLTHQVMERHSRVLGLDQMVRERDAELKANHCRILTLEEVARDRDVLLEELQSRVAILDETVRERDTEIVLLKEAARKSEQELVELGRQMSVLGLDQSVQAPDVLLKETCSRMFALDQLVQERDAQLNDCLSRLNALNGTVRERDAQIGHLNHAAHRNEQELAELGRQIGDWRIATSELNQLVANRDATINELANTLQAIYGSRVWKALAGLRWYGLQRRRLSQLRAALPGAIRLTGGVVPLCKLAMQVWRSDGLSGLKAAVRKQAARTESAAATESGMTVSIASEAGKTLDARQPEILFVSHEASRTGAPVFLLDLIRVVKERLHIKCTILLCAGGDLEKEFRELGDVYILASRHHIDALTMHALKQRDIRLIYANTITNGHPQTQLKDLGRPILCHVHELEYSIERIFGLGNLKRVLESTDYFVAGSGVVRRYLMEKQGVTADKVAIGYPFIDVHANEERARSSGPALMLPSDAIVIGACGTIGWRKGTDVFVQLAKRLLRESGRRIEFVWIGGPLSQGDYSNLRYDAEQLGIAEHLHFPGPVSEHLHYLAQCDIFVLPSREDPFPLVVLDAASLGCPIVCFDQAGGAPEFVENDAGRVVPYLDVDKMAVAVNELVEDATLRSRLGEGARAKVRARHDRRVAGAHLTEIIKAHLTR